MNGYEEAGHQSIFHTLNPDTVITLVENALGIRCTNLCRPLASYINRVYELGNFVKRETSVHTAGGGTVAQQTLELCPPVRGFDPHRGIDRAAL